MAHREDIEKMYQTHAQTVYRFLLKMTKNAELSEELTQDTFLRAMESADNFDGTCKLTTWLCQIAKNLFYDHLKYQSRHNTSSLPEEDIIPSSERSLEDCLCDAELARKLRALVHTLSEPYKEVFLLRVYAELPFPEIGLMFEKSDVWARVTYLRAKEKVLKMLEASDTF